MTKTASFTLDEDVLAELKSRAKTAESTTSAFLSEVLRLAFNMPSAARKELEKINPNQLNFVKELEREAA